LAAARAPRGPKRQPVQAGRATAGEAPAPEPGESALPPAAGAEAAEEEEPGGGGSSLNWNTRKVRDGRYRLKIVGSDAPTCPDSPATSEAISELVQVDNGAPRVRVDRARRAGNAPPAEVPVADGGSYLASAEYRVDGGEWTAAAAGDGIFDSPEETVRIDASRWKPGRRVLEIRARDGAGNEATAKLACWVPRAAAASVGPGATRSGAPGSGRAGRP